MLNKKTKSVKKISYSQSGEDLIISFIFNAIGIKNPSFIDIGAHHPYYLSNTALLYENGSAGINIEPDPDLFKAFIKYRKRNINLNVGIGDKNETKTFYKMNVPTLNTFSEKEANRYVGEGYSVIKKVQLKTTTIIDIINAHCNGVFPDFLNLDAEGIDEAVLKSINYRESYPKVICVETLSFSNKGRGIKNIGITKLLIEQNYFLYADTYNNSIFVKKDVWENI